MSVPGTMSTSTSVSRQPLPPPAPLCSSSCVALHPLRTPAQRPATRHRYRYEGLRYKDFGEIIQTLRSSLEKETGPFKQRKSNQRYEEWVKEAGGSILRRVLHHDLEGADSLSYVRSGDVFREAEEDTKEVWVDRLKWVGNAFFPHETH